MIFYLWWGVKAHRFGFNGKENDNEIKGTGNSLDFGARVYDSRLGRWLSVDPLSIKYPFVSPYNFALNTPIQAIDPDGRLVILVNGEVGQMNPWSNDPSKDRANVSYWSQKFVDIVKKGFNDNNIKFVDGDKGSRASYRYEKGKQFAVQNFESIIGNLQKDENGKIVESVNFVSHSKGAAFAAGMAASFKELRNSDKYKDLFAEEGGKVEMNLMIAGHQSQSIPEFENSETSNVDLSHYGDALSGILGGSFTEGDAINIRTSNGQMYPWETGTAHSIDGFHQEVERAIDVFQENKKDGNGGVDGKKYNNYSKVNKGDGGNKMYNRKNDKYEDE